MSNVLYDMMVDACLDQVEELSDQEVIERSQDVIQAMEFADLSVSIDELRQLLAERLMCDEMEEMA